MSTSDSDTHARIGALVQRTSLAAILAEDGPELESVRGPLRELVRLLASVPDKGAAETRAAVIQALDALDALDRSALNDALSAATKLWDAVVSGTSAGEPVVEAAAEPAAVHDELETLASDPELASMFLSEALDHLGSIEACVLQLEGAPDDKQLLNDVFRPFHTIKGNAGALGVISVQELAHKVENLLDLARSGKHRLGRAGIDIVLRSVDLLTGMLNDLSVRLSGGTVEDRTAARARMMADVDRLIHDGEDAVEQAPAAPVVDPAAPVQAAATPAPAPVFVERRSDRGADDTPEPGKARRQDDAAAWVKVDTRKLDNLVDMVGELVIVQSIIQEDPALLRIVDERLGRNLGQLKRITSDLQRNAMSMRMVPIRQTFQKMGRLVRDLGRASGKQVDLVLSGEDTELDRRVVEDINDPLMHMVRNSMDHGIETPAAREAQGKPAVGRLTLSAFHQGGNIVIAITDDGAGLNTDRILSKAVAQGLVEPGAQLSPEEIHQFIFKAGFSTAEKITEISGRGVGMDVVRRNIEALRGRIEIQSEPGKGTTFLIKLPLTLAILEGLLLGVGDQRFVLPTFSISESLRPMPSQVHHIGGVPRMIRVREQLLPLVTLADLFQIPGSVQDPTEATVVVIEDAGRRAALQVDRLLGKQEVVIKSLGEAFVGVVGVAGGAILGDGRIGLILDAQGLVSLKDGATVAA